VKQKYICDIGVSGTPPYQTEDRHGRLGGGFTGGPSSWLSAATVWSSNHRGEAAPNDDHHGP